MGEEHQDVGWRDRVEAWRGDRRIVAAVCACVAIAAAIAWWRAGAAAAPPAAAPPRASSPTTMHVSSTTTSVHPEQLVVDVVGAVRTPGIVRLGAGARVTDAIRAAGGATADADLVRLNLAALLSDGARLAVPAVGRPPPALDPSAVSGTPAASVGTGASGAASGPVNINTATAEELDALPGVGPATAAAIVSDRSAHGPFASVDDLQRVRGIGPSKLEQLRDLVTV